MEYYSIFIPTRMPDFSVKSYYTDKEEALKVLKAYKDARLKVFKNSSDAVEFYLNGPAIDNATQIPKSPGPTKLKLENSPFKSLKSQQLVVFRKNIESNQIDTVQRMIMENPRYLVSSGDTPTILKEGPRYNALHVCAMSNKAEMCKTILQIIEKPSFIELLHGQRNNSTEEVSVILLDLYLNTPDKGRGETPLHFAAKFGALDVIKVLISYPQCTLTKNSDGQFPKDVICSRSGDTDTKNQIEFLLTEKFFVPVLRSADNTVPPTIGEPFSPTNQQKTENDKFSSKFEIKAYAGPMDKSKAIQFFKRWKTPPRLIVSNSINTLNEQSPCFKDPPPQSLSIVASTPIAKKSGRRVLFPNRSVEFENEYFKENLKNNNVDAKNMSNSNTQDIITNDKNGNTHMPKKTSPSHELTNLLFRNYRDKLEDSYGSIQNDWEDSNIHDNDTFLKESGMQRQTLTADFMKKNNHFAFPPESKITPIKNPTSLFFTKYREKVQQSFTTVCGDDDSMNVSVCDDFPNAENLNNSKSNFSFYCDDNNSFYENSNIVDSPSFKERKIRLTDTDKGLEIIGRNLADSQNIGWKEYWNFLETFTDIKTTDGLTLFETFLKQKKNNEERQENDLKTRNMKNKNSNDIGSICAFFDNLNISPNINCPSVEIVESNATTINIIDNNSVYVTNLKILNPYICIDNSLHVFTKRFIKYFDKSQYGSMDFDSLVRSCLINCLNKLQSLVINYKKDTRFSEIAFDKIHSRYAYMIVANIDHEQDDEICNRLKTFLQKYRLQSTEYNMEDSDYVKCITTFLEIYLNRKDKLIKSNAISNEQTCKSLWDNIDSCCCNLEMIIKKNGNLERLAKRKERKLLTYNLTELREKTEENDDDDDDEFFSCTESSDDDYEPYETPPGSPSLLESGFDIFNDISDYKNFIEGDQPTKQDFDVLNAFENYRIDRSLYPHIFKWFQAMQSISPEDKEIFSTSYALKVRYGIGPTSDE